MKTATRPRTLALGVALAFGGQPGLAASPYPALPPTLSTSVPPNVVLFIDNSGSMLQDRNNNWLRSDLCNFANNWSNCVNNNVNNARHVLDDENQSPNTKMNIAKRVSRRLIDSNPSLRWGVFSFHVGNENTVGGNERGQSGVLQAGVGQGNAAAQAAISRLKARTATPLGEALLEISRYYEGKPSLYGKSSNSYTSPIQYRCQKNFAIVLTDGDATDDDDLPGSGKGALPYTYIDRNNSSQTGNFSVCTTSDNGFCPAKLEGSNNSPGFGDSKNRFRALRDVAKYANEMDMRSGGTDLDGKSFDDPRFRQQNMQTYTIGFSVNNEVLPAAAKAGGGKYYTADSEAALNQALTNAVSDIVASVSNAGGVATQSETVSAGNKVFQPVFNPKGWYGELRCYNLDSAGNFDPQTSRCTPNGKAVIPAASARNLHSARPNGSGTLAFAFNDSTGLASMNTAQRNAPGNNDAERRTLINYLRGQNISGLRTRPDGLLGDIIDSQPVVVGKPAGETPDADYAAFKARHASRNMVFIGANDGMLHAFSIADMSELMGFIPSPVYPNLKSLSAPDYGQSGGTPHAFHVNGSLRQADIKAGGQWQTLLVGGLAQGGRGYFAIDATQAGNFTTASDTVKWEWTDQHAASMGYAFGSPIIYNVRTSANSVVPAVILSNGYDNRWGQTPPASNSSALYVLNAETGALLKQIDVPGGTGLSSPAGVDYGQDGILDYVYAGDINGKLWRFDLTAESPSGFRLTPKPIFDAGPGKPIVMRPAVTALDHKDGTPIGNLVLFGTGKLLTDADRSDTTRQSLYGVLDRMEDYPETIPASSLVQQTITETQSVSSGKQRPGNYRKLSAEELDLRSESNTRQGWYIDLPAASERLVTSPLVFSDKVLFGTGIPQASEKCLPGGKGWIMGLNPYTGSVVTDRKGNPYSFVDIVKDGKSTAADKIDFQGGEAFASGFEKDGIPTELSYVASENRLVTPPAKEGSALGDIGKVIAMREANYTAVFTGNAKPGTTTGNPIGRPGSGGKGSLYGGTIGNDTVDKETLLSPSAGIRVETTLWREIK
ncbi:pilus assembly protein [Chitinilyticum litopenaei]|uniref:pilus assembly protein n=1 Tax=Chitinilyticum litopenaei TaxID=1121276 RepID=UPI00041C9BF5|nr:PilC/PilY family type IV pilus protein [Chitinilyticum litopenaei]